MDSTGNKKGIEIPTEEDMTILSSRFKEKTDKKDRRRMSSAMKTQEQERQSKKMELEVVKDNKT